MIIVESAFLGYFNILPRVHNCYPQRHTSAHNTGSTLIWYFINEISLSLRVSKTDYIVTGGLDGLIKVWKLGNGKLECIHTLQEHTMAVVSVAISPDGHSKFFINITLKEWLHMVSRLQRCKDTWCYIVLESRFRHYRIIAAASVLRMHWVLLLKDVCVCKS